MGDGRREMGVSPLLPPIWRSCPTPQIADGRGEIGGLPSPSSHLASGVNALARTRTATPFGTTPSRWRVYQFHHQGETIGCTGLTGLEPATSGVTDRHSN